MLIRSALLSHVPHGFSTRRGGVSRGMFESLNFGNPSELPPEERDPPANIAANFNRVRQDLGVSERRIVQVHQVHGAAVHTVVRGETRTGPDPRADVLATDDPGAMLCVRVADCAPVLLASESGSAVAAVHAGWRGVIADAAGEGVRALRRLTTGPLVGVIGPCIGPLWFEVGPEVVAEFDRAFPAGDGGPRPVVARRCEDGKGYIDLAAAIERQLRRAGVQRIESVGGCTASAPAEFFSHRRDRGRTGRMIGIIGCA